MRHYFLRVILILVVALLPGRMLAQSLILAQPTSAKAFAGDSSPVTFNVLAGGGGTPSYQWQVEAGGTGGFNNTTDGATYSGSMTAALTVANPNTLTNGTLFQVIVTVGSKSVTSVAAPLNVYSAPGFTPTVTVSPTSVAADYTGNITLTITGLNASASGGDKVSINRYAVTDGVTTKVDIGDPLVQSLLITDGQAAAVAGHADPDTPGDDDKTQNGTIVTHITLPTSPDGTQLTGTYLFKVGSPTNEFKTTSVTAQATLTITPASDQNQSVSGTVMSGGSPVPYAGVWMLSPSGHNNEFVGGAIADGNGSYTINAPPGTYNIFAARPGYIASFSGTSFTLTSGEALTGENPSLTPATETITDLVEDAANPATLLRGIQIILQTNSTNEIAVAYSDSDGNAVGAVTAEDDWNVGFTSFALHAYGYLEPQNNLNVDTTSGNVTGTLSFTKANALIYGTVTDNHGAPLPGLDMEADENNYYDDTETYPDGSYFLLAAGPTSGTADNWNVSPNGHDNFGSDLPPSGQNVNVLSGDAIPANFVATQVTAHFQGKVMNGNSPVTGVQVDANLQNNNNSNINVKAITANDGSFDLGVIGGTWSISLDYGSADENSPVLVGGLLNNQTITDGQTIPGLILPAVDDTGTISGTVFDFNGQPLSGAGVGAQNTTPINGVNYNTGSDDNNNGNSNGTYTIPVINGSWSVFVYNNNGLNYDNQAVVVNGSASNVNFTPTVFTSQPQDQTVTAGNSIGIGFNYNTPGAQTFQWQFSINGGTNWNNTADGSTYTGSTTSSLNINSATDGMNGYQYRCIVSFTYNGQNDSQTSNTATLMVNAVAPPPGINQQPSPQTVTAGQGASFSANVGSGSSSLQWQFSTDGGTNWANTVDGSTYSGSMSSTLNISGTTAAMNGYQYRLVIFYNNNNSSENSNAVALTVNAASSGPSFSLNPVNQNINSGQNASFSVLASGTPTPTYEWEVSTDGTNWSPLNDGGVYSGTATATLVLTDPGTNLSGDQYRVLAINSGDPSGVPSSPATLTVNTSPAVPAFTYQPASQTLYAGQNTYFSIGLTGSPDPTIQWQISTNGGSSWTNLANGNGYDGVTSATLVVSDVAGALSGTQYRAVLTNSVTSTTSDVATLTVNTLPTQPVLIASPVNHTIAAGTNISFAVLAMGSSLTYQWQISTNGGTSWTNLNDGNVYSGSSTPTLSVTGAPVGLSNDQYRCKVSGNGITINSNPGTLSVVSSFSNTSVAMSLSAPSLPDNSTSSLSVHVTGLNVGDTVRVERYLDLNGNGVADPADPLIDSHTITDGQVTSFTNGSTIVRDPRIPGDEDGAADGQITADLSVNPDATNLGSIVGSYIIKVDSPTNEFNPLTQPFAVTANNYGQTISGQVTSGGVGVPYAVAFLVSPRPNTNLVLGAVADASGNFVLNAPAGTYLVASFAQGYVTDAGAAPTVALGAGATVTQNLSLIAATENIKGQFTDAVTGKGIRGLQMSIDTLDGDFTGLFTLQFTNNAGYYTAAVVPGIWKVGTDSSAIIQRGYLGLQNNVHVDTTEGSRGGINVALTFETALIYGTLTDNHGNPLAGFDIYSYGTDNTFDGDVVTDASGNYFIGVVPGTWQVNMDDQNAGLANVLQIENVNAGVITAGQAVQLPLVATAATAHLVGHVTLGTDGGAPVGGLDLQANDGNGHFNSGITAADGSFDIGVIGGDWNLALNEFDNNTPTDIVGPDLSFTVTDGTDITNIPFVVLSATGYIVGTDNDNSGNPQGDDFVSATATINGVNYNTGGQADSDGNYYLPVVDGYWNVSTNGSSQAVTVNGNVRLNFGLVGEPTAFFQWQLANFSSAQLDNPAISGPQATPFNDGIPNLLRYALGIDLSSDPPSSSHPLPTVSNGQVTLSFTAAHPDITYTVQASTDLFHWTTTGVSITTSGSQITASYVLPSSGPVFLRVVVELNTP